MDRLITRIPVLLLLMTLALAAHVAVSEVGDMALLLACIPTALLLVLYLRAGRTQRRRSR